MNNDYVHVSVLVHTKSLRVALLLCLSIFIVFPTTSLHAQASESWTTIYPVCKHFAHDSIYYTLYSDSTAEVTDYDKSLSRHNLMIPLSITWRATSYRVTAIGDCAFYGYPSPSINLPGTILQIGNKAFGASNLSHIDLPSQLQNLGACAFLNCIRLKSVRIPMFTRQIGDSVFYGCLSLDSVICIGPHLSYIGKYAFSRCPSLTYIKFPTTLDYLGEFAFQNCNQLSSIIWPQFLFTLGQCAFANCESLRTIVLPNTLTDITGAFLNCTGLESIILPKSLTTISEFAFQGCIRLKHLTLSESIREIKMYAFSNCHLLDSISFPDSLEYIGKNAFEDCFALQSAIFPQKLELIDDFAFLNCITLNSTSFPNLLRTIGKGAFSGCCKLNSITFPHAIRFIGDDAFCGCTALCSVTFSEGAMPIEYFGDEVFANCISLGSITLPNTLIHIGRNSFANCTGLRTVRFPLSLISIGKEAFCHCIRLDSIYVPWNEPIILNYNPFCTDVLSRAALIIPSGSIDRYKEAPIWQDFSNIRKYMPAGIHDETDHPNLSGKKYDLNGRPLLHPQKGQLYIENEKVHFK